MKKLIYIFLVAAMAMGTSCKDFLDVNSPSSVDEDFVFTNSAECYKVLMGAYDLLRTASTTLYYDISAVGSDAECHPEAYSNQTRHIPEGLFEVDGDINMADYVTAWTNYYKLANRANIIIAQIEDKEGYKADLAKGVPTTWTQLYGEAVTLRAIAYHELTRFYGDIPHFKTPINTKEEAEGVGCASRDEINDFQIAELKRVEPMMYRLGAGGVTAERLSGTFVQGLIARICLYEGGYSTRRTDFDYGDVTFEDNTAEFVRDYRGCMYVRRSDYQTYYQIALQYLTAMQTNPGSAALITTDNRGSAFDNPFQRHFQYMMDLAVSPESLYEISNTQGVGNSEFGYAFSRPSDGGSANAYPCKAYGQTRIYPAFYYGEFDNKDLRRDVSVAVTGNSGACVEKIISFAPGSRSSGGLSTNKWDESRMSSPYTTKQRSSGINQPYMRMADAILMLAEVYAELPTADGGSESLAKAELRKVRSRAFASADQTEKVDNYLAALSGDALKDAIQQERKLEFAGEGLRRWDLIRTGTLPEKIVALRAAQTAMWNGLNTNGYYTFPNTGNTISNYIYTKSVNTADLGLTYMLTKQCLVAETDATYPVLFPSWRGQNDGWATKDTNFVNTKGKRNLAIKGLFEYIDPAGANATTLVTNGYAKVNWGINIKNNVNQYVNDIFKGYQDSSYAAKYPPRYILPIPSETITKSNGLITNGYGFAQP
jgi:starch-binding outer membrane protein, SusD/RagB family